MAERTRLPRFRYLALSRQGTIAMLTGHFEEARAFVDEAFALGGRLGEADRTGVWRGQSWGLALLQGNLEEAGTLVDAYRADADPWGSVLGASLAVRQGDIDLAGRLLSDVTPLREHFPGWFAAMPLVVQAEVAAATRDPQRCATARADLAKLVDHWAVVAAGVWVHGPMAHWCALIDAAQSRWDDAIAGFTAAQRAADRLGSRPWSIEARTRLAEALIARGLPADHGHRFRLAHRDRPRSEWPRHARHCRTRSPGASSRPRARRGGGPPGARPHRRRVPRRRRRVDPRLRRPHDPHARRQRAPRSAHLARTTRNRRAGHRPSSLRTETFAVSRRLGADPVLDDRAKARYRHRLAELDEEIDRALGRHDDDRAAELDHERQALIDELRRATGLAGRSRRLGDEGERARKTVTARVRDSMRRLDQRHPELAHHLRATISTGLTCRYQPAGDVTWTL